MERPWIWNLSLLNAVTVTQDSALQPEIFEIGVPFEIWRDRQVKVHEDLIVFQSTIADQAHCVL